MIANIDDNVGRLLAKLEGVGHRARHAGRVHERQRRHGRHASVFNAGMRGTKGHALAGRHAGRVVLALAGHASSPPRLTRLTAHIDFFPTIAEIAGAKLTDGVRAQIEGRSLVPLLRNPNAAWPDRILFTHLGRWPQGSPPATGKYAVCGVRNTRWHLVSPRKVLPDTGLNHWQLFDVKADVGETTDLAAEHPDVVKQLDAAYDSLVGLGAIAVGERRGEGPEGQSVQTTILGAIPWSRPQQRPPWHADPRRFAALTWPSRG